MRKAVLALCCIAGVWGIPSSDELLKEPDNFEYFSRGQGYKGEPLNVTHYSGLSNTRFRQLIASGIPFIVDDMAAQGFDRMKDWSCDWITKNFGGGRMQMSYGEESNDQDVSDKNWQTKQAGNGEPEAVVATGTPKYRPFYWDVKAMRQEANRPGGWGKNWQAIEAAVLNASVHPKFMDAVNEQELKGSPEFWLNPPEAGAKAHMDEHCIPTMAVQLSGQRTWRLGDIPKQKWGRSVESMYFDGHVYKKHPQFGYITHDSKLWRPTFSFQIKAGQGMFMPPGMIHETKNTGGTCATSITFQFPVPSPSVYWRKFLPRVSRTGDLFNCQSSIAILAGAGRMPTPHATVEPAWNEAKERFQALDANSDGKLIKAELLKSLSRLRVGQHYSGPDALVGDIILYHDHNEDGSVSMDEFSRNYAAFSINKAALDKETPVYWDPNNKERDGGDDMDEQDGGDAEDGRDEF